MRKWMDTHVLWMAGAVAMAVFSGSPAYGLLAGALGALTFGNSRRAITGRYAQYGLQFTVVLLGFGLEISQVLRVGFSSLGITLVSIAFTLSVGWFLGRMLTVAPDLSLLISSGTAICGGSAIAAISPAIGAEQASTAVAMAVVFLLNGIALFVFPYIGHHAGLGQNAFGLWSALAIHDTSSVVGAAATYGAQALAIGATVKLTRAMWIFPLSFACSKIRHTASKARVPWFLFGFVLAAILRSCFPSSAPVCDHLSMVGRRLMVGTLFLVGAGLTQSELRRVGLRPLLHAGALWLVVSVVSLGSILLGWIHVELPL